MSGWTRTLQHFYTHRLVTVNIYIFLPSTGWRYSVDYWHASSGRNDLVERQERLWGTYHYCLLLIIFQQVSLLQITLWYVLWYFSFRSDFSRRNVLKWSVTVIKSRHRWRHQYRKHHKNQCWEKEVKLTYFTLGLKIAFFAMTNFFRLSYIFSTCIIYWERQQGEVLSGRKMRKRFRMPTQECDLIFLLLQESWYPSFGCSFLIVLLAQRWRRKESSRSECLAVISGNICSTLGKKVLQNPFRLEELDLESKKWIVPKDTGLQATPHIFLFWWPYRRLVDLILRFFSLKTVLLAASYTFCGSSILEALKQSVVLEASI